MDADDKSGQRSYQEVLSGFEVGPARVRAIAAAYRALDLAAPSIVGVGSPLALALVDLLTYGSGWPAARSLDCVWDVHAAHLLQTAEAESGSPSPLLPALRARVCRLLPDAIACAGARAQLGDTSGSHATCPAPTPGASSAARPDVLVPTLPDCVLQGVLRVLRALWDDQVQGLWKGPVSAEARAWLDTRWRSAAGAEHTRTALKAAGAQLAPLGPLLAQDGMCWVSAPACTVRCDGQGRLHDSAGPALAYPDGWALWFDHGAYFAPGEIEKADEPLSDRMSSHWT